METSINQTPSMVSNISQNQIWENTQMQSYAMKNNLPQYKSIVQCHEALKKLDAETAISVWFIRQLCKDNKIKYFLAGNKSLVNYTDLLNYLEHGEG